MSVLDHRGETIQADDASHRMNRSQLELRTSASYADCASVGELVFDASEAGQDRVSPTAIRIASAGMMGARIRASVQ